MQQCRYLVRCPSMTSQAGMLEYPGLWKLSAGTSQCPLSGVSHAGHGMSRHALHTTPGLQAGR